jgi:hypothetical protein
MTLKFSTSIKKMSTQILLALIIANECYSKKGLEMVITSVSDSVHSNNSLHYSGFAADLRTNNISPVIIESIVADIKLRLTKEFDVIHEIDHIHIEFDPK